MLYNTLIYAAKVMFISLSIFLFVSDIAEGSTALLLLYVVADVVHDFIKEFQERNI